MLWLYDVVTLYVNYNYTNLVQEVSRLHFEPLAVACDISFILIGRFDCFGFVFATLSRKALE